MDTIEAIIFDVDGTLANIDHRLHFIKDGKRDWDAFFDAMTEDTDNHGVCTVAEMVAYSVFMMRTKAGFEKGVFVCSGRPDSHRAQTEAWLKEHLPILSGEMTALLMRPAGDHRSDVDIKREMLKNIRGQGYEPVFVVDDRQRVVDMWRDEGITCLQCAQWDEEPKQNVKPGKLTLLVGPSGAGKTRYTYFYCDPSEVISSDDLREELCGDFKDQSKNTQVFTALHALVKARIENGLDAVVDATNLRNRDRRAIRELVPHDTEIEYVIINRSLDEKQRDAGWRSSVSVKGVPLIEKHEQTFQSNLKDILAGDADPRVTVKDVREAA